MTHLTPEATQALYADPSGLSLTEQLTAAYERNTATGLAVPLPDSLATIAAAAVAEAQARTPDVQPLTGLTPEFQATAETAHNTYTQLFERVGINIPSLHEFAAAGIDFNRLGTAHDAIKRLGSQPELVFAPSNFTRGGWEDLYRNLQYDTAVNADGRIKDGGLYIDGDVVTNWNKLNTDHHALAIDGVDWQVLVLPGGNQPPIVNIDHNGKDGRKVSRELQEQAARLGIASGDLVAANMHPTIASYLALQAGRLQNNEEPIDSSKWTWLEGEFGDPSNLQAPRGRWFPVDGQVGLDWCNVGRRGGVLGARLPVWGNPS